MYVDKEYICDFQVPQWCNHVIKLTYLAVELQLYTTACTYICMYKQDYVVIIS